MYSVVNKTGCQLNSQNRDQNLIANRNYIVLEFCHHQNWRIKGKLSQIVCYCLTEFLLLNWTLTFSHYLFTLRCCRKQPKEMWYCKKAIRVPFAALQSVLYVFSEIFYILNSTTNHLFLIHLVNQKFRVKSAIHLVVGWIVSLKKIYSSLSPWHLWMRPYLEIRSLQM